MAIFEQAIVFPHVKLGAQQIECLRELFAKVNLLKLEPATECALDFINAYGFEDDVVNVLHAKYKQARDFGEQFLDAGKSQFDYVKITQAAEVPFFDQEMSAQIMTAVKSGGGLSDSDNLPDWQRIMTAGLVLLLAEDLESEATGAQNALNQIDAKSDLMWHALKGPLEPVQFQTAKMRTDFMDVNFVKKRLTAWSILATIKKLVNENVFVTFEKNSFLFCLGLIPQAEILNEYKIGSLQAVFYKLENYSGIDFLNLLRTGSVLKPEAGRKVILGLIEKL